MTFTHGLSTNNYGPAKFIVDASAANGTHTTIASALTASSSGDTIFIRPGTYSENLTLKAGVNLTAFGSDCSLDGTGKVIISGKATFTTAGSVSIFGIQLQTNSDNFLAITGSANSVVNLNNCYLNCTNATGITYSSSGASSGLNIFSCKGDLGTTGIAYLSDSGSGTTLLQNCNLANSGGSTTANTKSAGILNMYDTNMSSVYTYSSSSGSSGIFNSTIQGNATNTTALTTSGTGTVTCVNCYFASGTASAISIGANTTVQLTGCSVNSSNTNAVTGAGTLSLISCSMSGSSSGINTTTVNGRYQVTGGNRSPKQPAFLSYLGTTDTNVTGNGANYTLGSGNALTEVFDQDGNISTAGVFTAPVTGRYMLVGAIRWTGLTAATSFTLQVVASNRTSSLFFSRASAGQGVGFSTSVLMDMDAADTCTILGIVDGEAGDTADAFGGTPFQSYFSGYLVC